MCGIVGYVGPNFAEIVVVDGLKRLESRGYDSAGLAAPAAGALKILLKGRCEPAPRIPRSRAISPLASWRDASRLALP